MARPMSAPDATLELKERVEALEVRMEAKDREIRELSARLLTLEVESEQHREDIARLKESRWDAADPMPSKPNSVDHEAGIRAAGVFDPASGRFLNGCYGAVDLKGLTVAEARERV